MKHNYNSNQHGFSAVELIAIIAVVGIIGLLAFYVVSNNGSGDRSDQVATEQVNQDTDDLQEYADNSNQPEASSDETTLTNTYQDSNVAFSYPADWSERGNSQPEWVYLESADYEEPGEGLGPSVAAGYLLEVRVATSTANESYQQELDNSRAAEGNIGGSFEEITVDSNPAILSTLKTHGTYITGKTFYNDRTYLFRLNAVDENDPETRELFTEILQTVQLR